METTGFGDVLNTLEYRGHSILEKNSWFSKNCGFGKKMKAMKRMSSGETEIGVKYLPGQRVQDSG